MFEVTATQKGAIGESVVAIQLILDSGGRLSPFEPLADDDGIDLLIYDKKTGYAAPLQVKTRTRTLRRNPNIVHFQVRRATFSPNVDGFVLAVLLNPGGASVKRAWLVPMDCLPRLARTTGKTLALSPSTRMDSRDRYTPFRCHDIVAVADRLISHFDQLASGAGR